MSSPFLLCKVSFLQIITAKLFLMWNMHLSCVTHRCFSLVFPLVLVVAFSFDQCLQHQLRLYWLIPVRVWKRPT